MDKDLLSKIRADSLSKHEGATRKYGDQSLDSCKTVIVNRPIDSSVVKVIFEESDGWGHGISVPPDWLTEDHIPRNRKPCPRCGGAGKLTLYGIDCIECEGTGKIVDNTPIIVH